MVRQQLELLILEESFAICQLEAACELPAWALSTDFLSLTRTREELSIVCPAAAVPSKVKCQRGWRCLEVKGPLDFEEVGILNALTGPLADDRVSVFAISTYNTDYLLIDERDLERACRALQHYGHQVGPPESGDGR
jgi:hypothetical protein